MILNFTAGWPMKMMRLELLPRVARALLCVAAIVLTSQTEAHEPLPLDSEHALYDAVELALYRYVQGGDDLPLENKRWKDLTQEQRDRIRERYHRFQDLPTDEQDRIRKRYEWFKNLPSEERHQLREKWQRMTPEERKHFRKELKQLRKQRRTAYKHDV